METRGRKIDLQLIAIPKPEQIRLTSWGSMKDRPSGKIRKKSWMKKTRPRALVWGHFTKRWFNSRGIEIGTTSWLCCSRHIFTSNWTLPTWNDNLLAEVCKCPAQSYRKREVDLIDLMGKFFLASLIHIVTVNWYSSNLLFRPTSSEVCLLRVYPRSRPSTRKRLSCKHTCFPTDCLLCPVTQLLRHLVEYLQCPHYLVCQSLTTMEQIKVNSAACQELNQGKEGLFFPHLVVCYLTEYFCSPESCAEI
jgi:hypothetical protein